MPIMSEVANEIINKALSLSPAERAAIAEELFLSIRVTDKRIDAIWAAEAERRLAKYLAGASKSYSEEEVYAEFDAD